MAVVFKSSGDMDTVGILMAPSKKHRTDITQHQNQTNLRLQFKRGSTFLFLSVFPGFKHYFTAQHELPRPKRDWCASAGPCTCSHQRFLTAQPRYLSRSFDSTFHAEVLNDIVRNATVQEQLQFAWVIWFPRATASSGSWRSSWVGSPRFFLKSRAGCDGYYTSTLLYKLTYINKQSSCWPFWSALSFKQPLQHPVPVLQNMGITQAQLPFQAAAARRG